MDILLIILVCLAVYFPTLRYGLVTDDTRLAAYLQSSGSRLSKYDLKSIFNFVIGRLYGVGTFIRLLPCPACKGARKIEILDGKENKGMPCRRCSGTGKAWIINYAIEHAFTLLLHTITCVLIYLAFKSIYPTLLYAIHPMALQTSTWLNGRRYAVNQIITLAIMAGGPVLLPLYFITPSLQVNAIMVPVIFGLPGMLLVACVIALSWDKVIRPKVADRLKSIVSDDIRKFTPKRLIVIIRSFGFYMSRMVVPGRAMMIYPILNHWGCTEEDNKRAYSLDAWFALGLG